MSHTVKINVTMWAACVAVLTTAGGLVWAASARSNDLTHVSVAVAEVKQQRADDHETINGIKANLQTMQAILERIERKIP